MHIEELNKKKKKYLGNGMPYGLADLRDMEDLINYNTEHADCMKFAQVGIF